MDEEYGLATNDAVTVAHWNGFWMVIGGKEDRISGMPFSLHAALYNYTFN